MGKWVNDGVLDGALNVIKTGITGTGPATRLCACGTQPTTYADATSGANSFAVGTVTGTDFTIANGTSGRKVTVGTLNSVTVGTTGTASHVALADSANSVLLYVTTCTPQALTSGNTVNFPAWIINIDDPT